MRTARRLETITLLATLSATACASHGDGLRAGSVLRSVDNDVLDDSDDQYTSGMSLSYISSHATSFRETPVPSGVAGWLDEHWPFTAHDERFVIYSISHRIFTPTDLQATEIVEDDLPYSALLYGTATVGSQGPDTLDAFSLSAGVVGPAAQGEEVQTAIHDVIGAREPEGWDNQLENEPLLNVGFEHRRRMLRIGRRDGLGGDVLGGVSGSVGNLQTQATVAATARIGHAVPSNFHMQAPFLAEESLGLRPYGRSTRERSTYAFLGLAATLFANAIHLDGNTFRESHSVDHDHYVLRGSVGVACQYGSLLATVAYEQATLPWDHPEGFDDENYLRFGVSWDF